MTVAGCSPGFSAGVSRIRAHLMRVAIQFAGTIPLSHNHSSPALLHSSLPLPSRKLLAPPLLFSRFLLSLSLSFSPAFLVLTLIFGNFPASKYTEILRIIVGFSRGPSLRRREREEGRRCRGNGRGCCLGKVEMGLGWKAYCLAGLDSERWSRFGRLRVREKARQHIEDMRRETGDILGTEQSLAIWEHERGLGRDVSRRGTVWWCTFDFCLLMRSCGLRLVRDCLNLGRARDGCRMKLALVHGLCSILES